MYLTNMSYLKNIAVHMLLLCAPFLLLSQAQASDLSLAPKQVVTELIEAMEANDAEKIRSLFSTNATQEYERWWTRKKQGDAFRKWLESDIISVHGRINNPVLKANGNELVVTGTYVNNDNYSSAADFLLVVENGKIMSWTMRYD